MSRIVVWTAFATFGIIVPEAPRAAAYVTSSVGSSYQDTTLHNLSCPSGEEVDTVVVGAAAYLKGVRVHCPGDNAEAGDLASPDGMSCLIPELTTGISGWVDRWGSIDGQWIAELNLQCRQADGSLRTSAGVSASERGVGTGYFSLRCAAGDPLSGLKVFLGNSDSVLRRIAARCAE